MRRPDIDSGQLRDEMRELVRRAAEPARAGESVKAAISRAARVLGLSYGRCKRYWYGEIEVPPAHEVDSARTRVDERAAKSQPASTPAPAPVEVVFRPRLPIHVVYDENGRVWSARSHEFRDLLGATAAEDFDMADFVVRNLGWIEARHEPGQVHIRLAPRMAQAKALDAIYDMLGCLPTMSVVLHVARGQVWEQEELTSGLDAATRIGGLVEKLDLSGTQRFVALRRPLSVLFRDKQSNLVDMLYRIRDLQQDEDIEAMVRFAEADPKAQTGIALGERSRAEGGRTVWKMGHIARSLRFYTEEDRRKLIGSELTKGPDRDYGSWCQMAYDRAVAAGEPLVEDVRALILRRNAPPLESCYRRLLVPLRGKSGKTFILCTSEVMQRQAA